MVKKKLKRNKIIIYIMTACSETEGLENLCMILTKVAMAFVAFDIHERGLGLRHIAIIPALKLGWTNALAVRAIAETIGCNETNAAIFGNNTFD
jgi:hypothetical protein